MAHPNGTDIDQAKELLREIGAQVTLQAALRKKKREGDYYRPLIIHLSTRLERDEVYYLLKEAKDRAKWDKEYVKYENIIVQPEPKRKQHAQS